MKSYVILILIISLSLAGSFSNSYAEVGDFITSFNGSDGAGFIKPYGIAVDDTDRIIVADMKQDIVQIFNSTGSFVNSFNATDGSTAVNYLLAVAADSNGNIIVTDLGENIVQIFDSKGSYSKTIGLICIVKECGVSVFAHPLGVAVDSTDRIIVLDLGLGLTNPNIIPVNSIFVFDTRKVLSNFNSTDSSEVLEGPLAVAVDSNDRIIVADDELDIVQIFNSTGSFVNSFNGTDNGGAGFVNPYGIAVDSFDNIIVSDVGLHTIQIFDSEGVFLASFNGTSGGTAFVNQQAIAVDSNNRIIVADVFHSTVQIFEGFME